ncbi:hypothetical protein BKA69DRAFT_316806 [Paraphysoderma sedebokerense]|nr:hypothetical protein BKA69DRAFT_316806 [Paraphysoderma sedebokerense]
MEKAHPNAHPTNTLPGSIELESPSLTPSDACVLPSCEAGGVNTNNSLNFVLSRLAACVAESSPKQTQIDADAIVKEDISAIIPLAKPFIPQMDARMELRSSIFAQPLFQWIRSASIEAEFLNAITMNCVFTDVVHMLRIVSFPKSRAQNAVFRLAHSYGVFKVEVFWVQSKSAKSYSAPSAQKVSEEATNAIAHAIENAPALNAAISSASRILRNIETQIRPSAPRANRDIHNLFIGLPLINRADVCGHSQSARVELLLKRAFDFESCLQRNRVLRQVQIGPALLQW